MPDVVCGWEIRRCPRAVDFLPSADDLLALYHDGYLGHLSPIDRLREPAKLIAALVWVDQVWREHRKLIEEHEKKNGAG